MGALVGNASYLRFFVDGEPPSRMGDVFEQAVEARRFTPLTDKSEESESAGWVPLEDPFDDELPITRERFIFGDLIALAYREDKYALPRPLVKRRVRVRLEELSQKGEKITKVKRKQVELAVIAELKKRLMPRARVVDVVWDTRKRELRIFGKGPMVTERAVACFERTFAVRVVHATWAGRAFQLDLSLRARAVLEQLQPELLFDDIVLVAAEDHDREAERELRRAGVKELA